MYLCVSFSGLDERTLRQVSRQIGRDWQALVINLGFSENEILDILEVNPGDAHERSFKMLLHWRQRQPDNRWQQIKMLHEALEMIGRPDLLHILEGGRYKNLLAAVGLCTRTYHSCKVNYAYNLNAQSTLVNTVK